MQAPRGRFTLRGMMIALAFVTVVFGTAVRLWQRHVAFKRLADEYAKKSYSEMLSGFQVQHARYPTEGELRMGDEHFRLMDYYDELKAKYNRAAARPWLTVKPDRPPPDWPKDVPRSPPQSRATPKRPPTAVRLGTRLPNGPSRRSLHAVKRAG